ncbi:SDR family NAD(P)-dependent oxidoreductase [Aureibacillus halotolerans]|uniref:Ketoreductase domain-containing protein n=1 Tax=Aureibacillus halotolerans TaxID=1508390 RepID=A0A4R6U9U9_9BACI|nr:SDR family oxidoreductase [Aureibacillus halotolerans]TDQ41619.1 hypothetical protein EV213_103198 [Aureibacillus halotolerans]
MNEQKPLVVITGASGGIGASIAKQAAKQGYRLALVGRSRTRLEKTLESIDSTDVQLFPVDIADSNQVYTLFTSIQQTMGPIDVLVNNAGFGRFIDFQEHSQEDVDQMINVNVNALMHCTRAVLPSMTKRKKGHIINVASQAGRLPTPKATVYAASKHAVIGFSQALRMEVKNDSVYVTLVNPGPVNTPFFDEADPEGTYRTKVAGMMIDADQLAAVIVQAFGKNKREINRPIWMHIGAKLYQACPPLVEFLFKSQFHSK